MGATPLERGGEGSVDLATAVHQLQVNDRLVARDPEKKRGEKNVCGSTGEGS